MTPAWGRLVVADAWSKGPRGYRDPLPFVRIRLSPMIAVAVMDEPDKAWQPHGFLEPASW